MPTAISPVAELLSRDDAARYMNVRPQTLACWASSGRYGLRYIRVGRSVRYRKSDLDAWLASRTVQQTEAE
jgi:excisionase family DNA binding protein